MTSQETEIEFAELKKIGKKDGVHEIEYKETPTFSFVDGNLTSKR